MNKEPIHFYLEENGTTHPIDTHTYEYRNLMLLIADKIYLEVFGECGGLGRCATCLVQLKDDQQHVPLEGVDRNEHTTVSRMGITDESIRLSCQILVTPQLEGRTFTILEQEY